MNEPLWSYAIAALAIVGAELNARKMRAGFICWMVSNAAGAWYLTSREVPSQAVVLAVLCGFAVRGWWAWRPKKKDVAGDGLRP